jgi:hypothetical protein
VGNVLPLVCFGERHTGLAGLAVSSTPCGGASNMAARRAMCYLWSVLVNPIPGWLAWLSPPPEAALQTWRPGGQWPPSWPVLLAQSFAGRTCVPPR